MATATVEVVRDTDALTWRMSRKVSDMKIVGTRTQKTQGQTGANLGWQSAALWGGRHHQMRLRRATFCVAGGLKTTGGRTVGSGHEFNSSVANQTACVGESDMKGR